MRIQNSLTDQAVLRELGSRLREARLRRNLSQVGLAEEAGVGRVTLQRIEDGRSASLTNLVRVLRALELLDDLDRAIPETISSPVDHLRRRGERRLRAGSPRSKATRDETDRGKPWRWGDEEAEDIG